MTLGLTTPAILFPAISLLLLAFTNRFLAIASLIRQLHAKHTQNPESNPLAGQIENLRKRLKLIRTMQFYGVLSFALCVVSMISIFQGLDLLGSYIFGGSLILLLVSLIYSLIEIQISTDALDLELNDMKQR